MEQEVQQGIIIEEIDEYGILQETVLIYLGDGIYAEKPKEFSRNKRKVVTQIITFVGEKKTVRGVKLKL